MKLSKKAGKEALKVMAMTKDDLINDRDTNMKDSGNEESKEKSMLAELMMKWTETGKFV